MEIMTTPNEKGKKKATLRPSAPVPSFLYFYNHSQQFFNLQKKKSVCKPQGTIIVRLHPLQSFNNGNDNEKEQVKVY